MSKCKAHENTKMLEMLKVSWVLRVLRVLRD